MRKRIITICLIFVFCIIMPYYAQAAPTDTYTHVEVPGNSTALGLSREMYETANTIDASSLGLEDAFEGITDICCAADGTILLLCGGNSRLIRINSDYTLKDELTVRDQNAAPVDFTGARGVYSDEKGIIYIADTMNGRILMLNEQGEVINTLEKPQSDLIPDDFVYQPAAVAKDPYGYTYILSLGCYYGALLYAPDNSFLGFYGANTVAASALDTLSYLWERLTSNDTKKAASVRKLPYSFVDFSFDTEGYMVTCTDNTGDAKAKSNGVGQIRKISPTGENILYKRQLKGDAKSSADFNFLESSVVYEEETGNLEYRTQKLVSIAVSDDGFIFALDNTNGTVYIYDDECNLMSAFGGGLGRGEQEGVFKTPVALAIYGDLLFVADYAKQNVTVFTPTEYGTLLRSAQSAYLAGDYNDAKEEWQQILAEDSGNQLALRGLAMVYYNEGDYETALTLAEAAYDYSVYDLAFQAIFSEWAAQHFVLLLVVAMFMVGTVVAVVVISHKRNKQLIANGNLKLMLYVPFHPFQSFGDMKYKGKYSWIIAVVLTGMLYVSQVLKNTASGFLYMNVRVVDYNAIYTLIGTVGLLILWSVCNWLVCSMMGGIGTLKEVYIATSYALWPMIIWTFIRTMLSNFLPLSVSGLLGGIDTFILIFTFFLFSVAIKTVHEYDFSKFLWTGIITIFMMILVVFVLFMCLILLKQFWSFIYSVYEEILYR